MRDLPPRVPRPAPPQTLPAPTLDLDVSPLVTEVDAGHRAVTFSWRGQAAEVRVLANKLTHDTDAALMERTGDLWHRTYLVPAGWRASYRLSVDGAPLTDPLNPRVWQGFSIAETAPPSPWLAPGGEPRHELTRHPVGWRYDPLRPPRATLVVLDGEHWADDLPVMLDNLIEAGALPPVTAWLVESGPDRARRLTCDPEFVDALPYEGATVIAGQSFGGLAAVYAAHRRPDRFVAAVSQSGSFWWPNGPSPEWLTSELSGTAPPTVHLQVGTDEWALTGPTERLRERLGEASTFRTYAGGHDRYCWRNELADALITAFAALPR
ncbi:enterochelin esterase family protein [Nonomuraea thailandensis]|uniref:Enterochelin esterase family protein n=1 Tax=Nonomuraea thailandensis TaxID=1188745 RepID=A0A9X2K6G7_9ACTN|nr:alpha/beta hydrolase-fold protein [Nonomuraea thailandensis]MCP2361464.1 enterochelin esterase family protein [Nonomuraea thailandensis]